MDISAILSTMPHAIDSPSSGKRAEQVAHDFEAAFWQVLVGESRLFESGLLASTDEEDGSMYSVFSQMFASQLAESLDLGIGRLALGMLPEGDGND